MEPIEQKIYCSLDIETSGFDPYKNEVIEIGLVFFEAAKDGLKILNEYTKVFKPKGFVPPVILQLTGISTFELDNAKPFALYKEEIQEQLRDAIVIGHNIMFDINFLKALGIEFSGKIIDTLDLVQFLLPTHHSYNLENLMHTFGVSHKEAHRALADAKATVVVLERLISKWHKLPKALQAELLTIATKQVWSWPDLLSSTVIAQSPDLSEKEEGVVMAQPSPQDFTLEPKTIYNFPLGENYIDSLVTKLEQQKTKVLLVLPKNSLVFSLWKNGFVGAAFSSERLFDEKKFQKFLKNKNLSPDEAKFALKVLVWQNTNWQTISIFDLNLSFFGGQFKDIIAGGEPIEDVETKIVACDLEAWEEFSREGLFEKRFVVFAGLNEFEQQISSSMGLRVAWGSIVYTLRSIYNPELQTGSANEKELIVESLEKTDLFFGLVHALLGQEDSAFQYFVVDKDTEYSESFNKVRKAAENFSEYLLKISKKLKSAFLERSSLNLQKFFEEDQNSVKWIELGQSRCIFYSSPLDISELVRQALKPFKKFAFADSVGGKRLVEYFVARLGLKDSPVVELSAVSQQAGQKTLFESAKNVNRKIIVSQRPQNPSPEELMALLKQISLPAAVLFGSTSQIKELYDLGFNELKTFSSPVAQTLSTGSNKMFHNFTIHPNGLLLVTSKFVVKHLENSVNLSPVGHVPVKTLVICSLPFQQYTHPYEQAVAARFSNSFMDYSLPKALYNFHCLLNFFNSGDLETIYLWDAKLSKDYAKAFVEYLKYFPSITLGE